MFGRLTHLCFYLRYIGVYQVLVICYHQTKCFRACHGDDGDTLRVWIMA